MSLVRPYRAALQLVGDGTGRYFDFGPDRRCQPIWCRIDSAVNLIDRTIFQQAKHRAERLFSHNAGIVRWIDDDGRLDEMVIRPETAPARGESIPTAGQSSSRLMNLLNWILSWIRTSSDFGSIPGHTHTCRGIFAKQVRDLVRQDSGRIARAHAYRSVDKSTTRLSSCEPDNWRLGAIQAPKHTVTPHSFLAEIVSNSSAMALLPRRVGERAARNLTLKCIEPPTGVGPMKMMLAREERARQIRPIAGCFK